MKTASSTTEYVLEEVLPKDALDAMEELGLVLKTIYLRMQKEGYRIENGALVNENDNE